MMWVSYHCHFPTLSKNLRDVRRISFREGLEHMASAVARAYNGTLGAEPLAGSRGRTPGGGQGAKPPEAESFLL